MPVRDVVTRSRCTFRGKTPSLKNRRSIHWESTLERDAIAILEFSPAVRRYEEQPFQLEYDHHGVIRTYIPDFLAELQNGQQWVFEVKPAAKLAEEEEQDRFRTIAESLREKGYAFRTVDEIALRPPNLQSNLNLLFRLRATAFAPPAGWPECSLPRSVSYAGARERFGEQLDALLGYQAYLFDYKEPLEASTQLFRNERERHEHVLP